MKLLFFILLSTLYFRGNCTLNEASVASKWPFCTDISLQENSLVEHFSSRVGGQRGSNFLTCTLKYWRDAFLDSGDEELPYDFTVLINPETEKPQSAYLYDGGEIIPSADPYLLDSIKDNLSTFNGSYDELHYFEDDFFMVDGIRLVFNDPEKENLVRFWNLPIKSESWGIFIPSKQWIPESKFLKDIHKFNEFYDTSL